MAYCRLFIASWFFSFGTSCLILFYFTAYYFQKPEFSVPLQERKIVIFDLGNVLIRTNHYKALRYLGIKDTLFYRFFHWRSFQALQSTVCTLLDTYTLPIDHTPLCDSYGRQLPHLFSDTLKGVCTESQARPLAYQALKNSENCFYNKREERLCKKTIELMFNPELLITTQELMKDGFLLLKECLAAHHEVFICSNMSEEMFELIKNKFPELFSLIPEENIIISAHVKAVKPEQAFYTIVCKRLIKKGLKPTKETCFFIDDQLENIEALNNQPIQGIHKKSSFKNIKKFFKKQGLLKKQSEEINA